MDQPNKYWTENINGRSWCITQRLVGTPQTYYIARSKNTIHTNKKLPALLRKLKEKSHQDTRYPQDKK